MPEIMSTEDYEAARLMLETGALIRLEEEKLPKSGWCMTYCGDGEVTPAAISEHTQMFSRANGHMVCAHVTPWDGGPAGISPRSPFHTLNLKSGKEVCNAFDYMIARIEGVQRLKGEKVVNWGGVPHCGCGMCRTMGVSLWDNIRDSIEGKDLLRGEFGRSLRHYKIVLRLDFSGYPEADTDEGPFWNRLVKRTVFERLYDRWTSQSRSDPLWRWSGL